MAIVLHVDMNSYFASVEQQANPFLRGKAVAICSRLSRNACVIACSIEAKKQGVKTGMGLSEAKLFAPHIVALEVDPPKIRSTTDRIFRIFADYTSAIEPYSIDEAFLDLTGFVKDFEDARSLALRIKARIKNEVGEWLKCSIGIAPTRWLAKYAGELQKPDGLTVLRQEDLVAVYTDAPLEDAWGIAGGWRRRLEGAGLRTLLDLYRADPQELLRRFGKMGYILWANISGLDIEPVHTGENVLPKSIGHSYVLPRPTSDQTYLGNVLMKLCERMGRRLRRKNLEVGTLSVGWRLEYSSNGKGEKLAEPLFDSLEIYQKAWSMFKDNWRGERVAWLAVTSHQLVPAAGQLSFFKDRQRQRNLVSALDKIQDRYGEFTVIRGSMFKASDAAPERVGFRQTVEVPKFSDLLSHETAD